MTADLVGASEDSVEVSEDPAGKVDLLLEEVEASGCFVEAPLAALLAPSLRHRHLDVKNLDHLKGD